MQSNTENPVPELTVQEVVRDQKRLVELIAEKVAWRILEATKKRLHHGRNDQATEPAGPI